MSKLNNERVEQAPTSTTYVVNRMLLEHWENFGGDSRFLIGNCNNLSMLIPTDNLIDNLDRSSYTG